MTAWHWALLLKPLGALLIIAAYYVVVYKGSHLLGRFIPNGKVKEFLFRERGRYDAGNPANARNHAGGNTHYLRSLIGRDRS